MKHLNIDIETYSSIDIAKSGAFKYSECEDFEVLLFGYAVDFGKVQVVDLTKGEEIPAEVLNAMADDRVIKHAFNASFEYSVLDSQGYDVGSRSGWRCTALHSRYLGYPGSLKTSGKALGLDADKVKLDTGTTLINYFCKPCKPTKANGRRTRNLPEHDLDKWALFVEYNRRDVVAEMEIYKRLESIPVPEREQRLWELTDKMNALGVRVDKGLYDGALDIDFKLRTKLIDRAKEITGLQNPNSGPQLKSWLEDQGLTPKNLTKATVVELIEEVEDPKILEVLKIKQQLAKSSVSKYQAFSDSAGHGSRVRGMFMFYGANRTGRFAGRLVQPQNLPRNYLENLDLARELIANKEINIIELVFGNVPDTLSQLIRTTFIPSEGHKFIVADYSAIEARVLAWLAGEKWVMEVFATHGKIYEATASQMFGVPIEKIVKGNPEYELRQRGKVATLALGYQGSIGALKAMGADKMGLDDVEMESIVSMWRNANAKITKLWSDLQKATIHAIETGEPVTVNAVRLSFIPDIVYGLDKLKIDLPSGRALYYPSPFIGENQWGMPTPGFFSQDKLNWSAEYTYGGKLTENIVQAIARDCLCELLLKLDDRFPQAPVVMHIHDEVVLDSPQDVTLDQILEVMAEPIDWAPGLVLKGAGFEGDYYMKD